MGTPPLTVVQLNGPLLPDEAPHSGTSGESCKGEIGRAGAVRLRSVDRDGDRFRGDGERRADILDRGTVGVREARTVAAVQVIEPGGDGGGHGVAGVHCGAVTDPLKVLWVTPLGNCVVYENVGWPPKNWDPVTVTT